MENENIATIAGTQKVSDYGEEDHQWDDKKKMDHAMRVEVHAETIRTGGRLFE